MSIQINPVNSTNSVRNNLAKKAYAPKIAVRSGARIIKCGDKIKLKNDEKEWNVLLDTEYGDIIINGLLVKKLTKELRSNIVCVKSLVVGGDRAFWFEGDL